MAKYHYPFPCIVNGQTFTVRAEKFWSACKRKVEQASGLEWNESVVQGVAPV